MIQAFRLREISKYDDGGQLMSAAKLCLEAVVIPPWQALIGFCVLYFILDCHLFKFQHIGCLSF